MSTILVVDDRPINRRLLVTLLGYGGHRLLEADDGQQALALARAERPDLIITDMVMPVADGVELTRRLRAEPDADLAATPVVFYTATYREREARALAASCGVSHVLVKPVEPQVLLEIVDRVLGALPADDREPQAFPAPAARREAQLAPPPAGQFAARPERMWRLLELCLQLGEARETEAMLGWFAEAARDLAGVRWLGAGLLADDGARLSHFVLVGPEGVLPRPPPAVKDGLFARLLAESHPVRLTAGRAARDLPAGHPRADELLAAPVLLHGLPVGGLYLADRQDGERFDAGDEWLAVTLGTQLAVAHERVRLVDELQRHAASLRLEALERQRAEAALAESEARFRALVQNATDIISVLDAQGRVQYSSPSGETALGRPAADQAGRDGLEHIHPDDLDAARTALAEIARTPGASTGMQVRVRHADGSWHVFDAVGRNLLHDPAVRGIVINARDVTERQRAEEALRQSEAQLRALVGSMDDLIIESDAEGTYLNVWTANEGLLVRPRDQLLGRTVGEVLGENFARPWLEAFRRVLATGQSEDMHFEMDLADGRRWFESRINPVLSADGSRRTVSVLSRDVTERKRAEEDRQHVLEALQRTNATLQALIDTLPTGVLLADARGALILSNRIVHDLYGGPPTGDARGPAGRYSIHRLDGTPFPPEALPLPRALAGEATQNPELLVRREDGSEVILLAAGCPVRDASGAITGAVASLLDVTEQRRILQELHTADKLESIGVLAGGIAHDFNNLLAAILANLSLVRLTGGLSGKPLDRLADAEKAGLRAKDLTQRLLTFAKGGAPIRQPVALGQLLRDSAAFALSGSNVRPDFDIAPDLWPAVADAGQIGQVIQNLVLNAHQAMPQGGTVRLRAENALLAADLSPLRAGPYVRLSVADHGVGIPAELLPKIFDPFFTTKPDGSGLGLATCHSIVRRHDGHIAVESRPGLGTTFTITLPASPRPGQRLPETTASAPAPPEPGQGRLLIMDDEAALRDAVGELLTRLGYEVTTACDGAEAVDLYRQAREAGRPFDGVILDLTVPGGMGGRETIRRLAALDPQVRALVSSGYSNDPIMTDFRAHGFQAVVAKPFTMEELSRAVQRLIGGGNGPAS